MAKDLKEQIEIMTYYLNGGEVEYTNYNGEWNEAATPTWDWCNCNYRIKEKKKTVTIKKWLVKFRDDYYIQETSNIDTLWKNEKVKLLDTYKVEL